MYELIRNNNIVKMQEKVNSLTTLRVDTEPRQRRGESIKLNCLFFLFVFCAVEQAFGQNPPVSPHENSRAEVSLRPKVEYKAETPRNPFYNYLKAETYKKPEGEAGQTQTEEKVDLAKFIVQGIIWGGQLPQAIINDRVLTIGDVIEESKIETIDKSGVTLSFKTQIFKLSSPASGQMNNQAKN